MLRGVVAASGLMAAACLLFMTWPGTAPPALANPVAVLRPEGPLNTRLVLKAADGPVLAAGDFSQQAAGGTITSRLVFHFKDGSLHEETTVYTQQGHFRVLNHHLVQRGPAFTRPLEMTVDAERSRVDVRYRSNDGEQQFSGGHVDLPQDLANGIVPVLLKNAPQGPVTASMVVPTPSPQVVRLVMSPDAASSAVADRTTLPATHYIVKIEIGGLAGFVAPLIGLQPPDSDVWIARDEPAEFLRSRQPFYYRGPLWQVEVIATPPGSEPSASDNGQADP